MREERLQGVLRQNGLCGDAPSPLGTPLLMWRLPDLLAYGGRLRESALPPTTETFCLPGAFFPGRHKIPATFGGEGGFAAAESVL